MSVPVPAAGPLLLDYTLSTVPARLRVSTATQDKLGRIDLTVTGGTIGSPFFCEQITIPIGSGHDQLTEAAPGVIAKEVSGGTGSSQGGGWDPTESTSRGAARTFSFTPRRDEATFNGGWTLKLSLVDIPLNRQPCDAPITITESTRTDNDDYETRKNTVPITKSPPEFIFTDFRPEQIAASRAQSIKLHWVCDGDADTTFTLYWTGNTSGEPIGKGIRVWPPSGRSRHITKDTSFMLRTNTRNANGAPEHRYQTIVINCTDPDINANALNVTNTSNLNGETSTKNLTVNSNNTLKVSKMESSGWAYGIHVNSPLQISGFLNGYNNTRIAINNGLNVSGGLAGARVVVTRQSWTTPWKETSGRKQDPDNQVMVGRGHTGDENGNTEHLYATIRIE
ncbi:hypothetical protein [Streptomyces lavendulae]|uniref:hypothetical protein n=1 Tax=Streptomyces lavendulae TaxID=1914 RepID=UPI003814A55D